MLTIKSVMEVVTIFKRKNKEIFQLITSGKIFHVLCVCVQVSHVRESKSKKEEKSELIKTRTRMHVCC